MKIHGMPNGWVVRKDDGSTEMFKSLDEAILVIKHGNHDQSVHGHKGGGAAPLPSLAPSAEKPSTPSGPSGFPTSGTKSGGKFKTVASVGEKSDNKMVVHVVHDEATSFSRGTKPAAMKIARQELKGSGWGMTGSENGHSTNPDGSVVSTYTFTKN